ncbi:hypothetical protein ONS95_014137 [Cadophora gregata]|uniref:uncharacterized protein n=1 Tax=Cadophora gregata TaxID=51156 RepID=UPI0026DD6A52|nr:uncharacterized protein ONS95_014137 [Cadophora gregata]KAK0114651.1 hypothetical protein ONS95_014137 [Cadophora gregata]
MSFRDNSSIEDNGGDEKQVITADTNTKRHEGIDSSKAGSDSSQESTTVVDVRGSLDAHQQPHTPTSSSSTTQYVSTPRGTLKRRRSAKTNPPFAIKGVRMADNPKHTLNSLAEVGKPDDSKMRFKLKIIGGGYTKAFRFEGRKNPEWDNKEWVNELNKWRIKILKRYFKAENAATNNKKSGPRVRWSYAELEYLRMQIRKRVRFTGTTLSGKDWKKLTEQHNERFQGKMVRVGEKLAGGRVAVTDQIIERRSQAAMTALYGKYDDLRQIVHEEITAFGTEASDDTPASYNSSQESNIFEDSDEFDGYDEDESGIVDYDLENSSDDEDEGRRPIGQPVGGRLVTAAS